MRTMAAWRCALFNGGASCCQALATLQGMDVGTEETLAVEGMNGSEKAVWRLFSI
jgi:hypothetical protein